MVDIPPVSEIDYHLGIAQRKRQEKWDNRFMKAAIDLASWSKDPSRGVGCVIVKNRDIIVTGYNGFPRNCNDNISKRYERPLKYSWTVHSEINAICAAARRGQSVDGCTAYVTLFPCSGCAKALVQAGINCLISPSPDLRDPNWGDDFEISLQILIEGKVERILWCAP